MGFQPIQGDYFEKPTGLTTEDLLKWDGSALARLAKGSNGQFLGVNGSGNLAYANAGNDLLFYRHGVGSPIQKVTTPIELLNDATEYTKYVSSATYVNVHNDLKITINTGLNANISETLGNLLLLKIDYIGGANCSVGVRLGTAEDTNITSSRVQAQSTAFGASPSYVSNAWVLPSYGAKKDDVVYVQANLLAGAGCNSKVKNTKIYLTGYTFPTNTIEISTFSSIVSGVKYIELYDNGDSIKLNDDTDLIFTGVTGNPIPIWYPGDDISKIEILSGNPLIVFEKA